MFFMLSSRDLVFSVLALLSSIMALVTSIMARCHPS
jgi:hypothetical protein